MTLNSLAALLLFILFAQMLLNARVELKYKSVTFLIWPVAILFLVLPLCVHLIKQEDGLADVLAVNYAIAIAIIFNFFYILGFLLTAFLSREGDGQVGFVKFGQGCVSLLPYIIAGLLVLTLLVQGVTLNQLIESTWRDKQELGFAAVVVIWLMCALGGLFCYAIEEKNFKVLVFISVVAIAVIVFYRTRALISVFVVSLMLYFVLVRKTSIRSVLIVGLTAIFLAVGLRALRFLGALSNVTDVDQFLDIFNQMSRAMFVSGDLSIYRLYLRVVVDCHAYLDCFNFSILKHLLSLLGVVEREGLRIEYDLYRQLIEGGVNGSLHPTIYGLIYADMGLFAGVGFFFFIGFFNCIIGRFAVGWRFYAMVGFVAPYIVFFPRGSFYNSLSLVVVGCVYTVMIGLLFKIKRGF